ncbi:MAG: hypothetical protein A3J97_10710 [Spirochaetes bacterium RIFOXYC1_FULL_54_7]|nr:MAG: hypothetical protein A3J97_10710 [Spirochaetes bacterium RIFOXYC1_FULL_54_7]
MLKKTFNAICIALIAALLLFQAGAAFADTDRITFPDRELISVPLSAFTVNGTAYVGVLAVDKAMTLKSATLQCVVIPVDADGTSTLALTNYDISATTGDNMLSTATVDCEALTALTQSDLTLSATAADLVLANGDFLYVTLVNNSAAMTNWEGAVLTLEVDVQ